MAFYSAKNIIEGQGGQAPAPVPEEQSFWSPKGSFFSEVLPAAWATENPGGALASSLRYRGGASQIDLEYDPFEASRISGYEQFADSFVGVNNDTELTAMKAELDRYRKHQKTLDEGGWMGMAAVLLSAAASPTMLLPGGQIYRGLKVGQAAWRTGLSTAAWGGAGAAIDEAILYGAQPGRSQLEALIGTASGALLGGALGAGIGAFASRSARSQARLAALPNIARTQEHDAAVKAFQSDLMEQASRSSSLPEDQIEASIELLTRQYEAAVVRSGMPFDEFRAAYPLEIRDGRIVSTSTVKSVDEGGTPGFAPSSRAVDDLQAKVDDLEAKAKPDPDGVTYNQDGRVKTETPEFRAWFGEGKLLDPETGEPSTFYHGTPRDFDGFDTSAATERDGGFYGKGIYLTDDADEAFDYSLNDQGEDVGRVIEAHVKMERPFEFDLSEEGWPATRARLSEAGFKSADRADNRHSYNLISSESDRFSAWAKENGFDGVVVRTDRGISEVVAFDPTQIKSVNNRGTYDPSDPRILYQGATESPLSKAREMAATKVYPTGREFKVSLQEAALAAQREEGIDLSDLTPENIRRLADMLKSDAIEALQDNVNAIGWYDRTVTAALESVAELYPEVATNLVNKLQFIWALAVTSNGLKVDKNFEIAGKAYEALQTTGSFPTNAGIGDAASAINSGLGMYHKMLARFDGDHAKLVDFMNKKTTVREIEAEYDVKISGEGKDTLVRGASILGPKIGNGFFSNLYGNFDELTMDRWLMRTVGRWRGTLIKRNAAMEAKKRAQITALFSVASPDELRQMRALYKGTGARIATRMTKAEIDVLAAVTKKASMDPAWRERLNAVDGGALLRKAANGLYGYLDGQVEAPSGPRERTFIRAVFTKALGELNDSPEMRQLSNAKLTMSDLQALLWYPEKRLYDSAKGNAEGARGYADDDAPDYANAARKYVNNRLGRSGTPGRPGEPDTLGGTGRVRDGKLAEGQEGPLTLNQGEVDGVFGPERGPGRGGRSPGPGGGAAELYAAAPPTRAEPLPSATKIGGKPFGPIIGLVDAAERYAAKHGIELRRQGEFVSIDEARSRRIADAYDAMPHAPGDPRVQASYRAMINQVDDQYQQLIDDGYEFYLMDPASDPYNGNPWEAMRDLRDNKRMAVFPTGDGFGTDADFDPADNMLMEFSGREMRDAKTGDMVEVRANDLFRAVHDAFGHGLEGSGFRARGEENAWQAHSRLFTGDAVGAMTSETRGQNSWLNYGPHAEANKTAKVEDTVFANQKMGLMPEWTWAEGRSPDAALPLAPSDGPNILYQSAADAAPDMENGGAEIDGRLFVAHNLSIGKLLHADKMGGLPMPSLAVTRADVGFDDFGEVSLIGAPDLVDPKAKGVGIYDADVYTPRYPSIDYTTNRKALDALEADITAAVERAGLDPKQVAMRVDLESDGLKWFSSDHAVRILYLDERGIEVPLREPGRADTTELHNIVDGRRDDFDEWLDGRTEGLIDKERIFKGFTNARNRRYAPHTIDNVLKDMKSRLKEGEGFNYGAGTIRSKHAKKFKNLKDVMADRDRIVTEAEIKDMKDEFQQRIMDMAESARDYYKFDKKSFSYIDDFSDVMAEMASKGPRALDEIFDDLPAEIKTDIVQYLNDLRLAPTQYFEAKLNRIVTLDEFDAAVVPHDLPAKARAVLERAGLRIEEYASDAERRVDVTKHEHLLFQSKVGDPAVGAQKKNAPRAQIQLPSVDDPRAIITMFNGADASSLAHEGAHFFLNLYEGLAARTGAADDVVADVAAIRKWLGATDGEALTRAQHEQWASGFEQYMRTGKPPKPELQGLFNKFRGWLVEIYEDAKALGVKISPEIEAAMGRMMVVERKAAMDAEQARFTGEVASAERSDVEDGNAVPGAERPPANDNGGSGSALDQSRPNLSDAEMDNLVRQGHSMSVIARQIGDPIAWLETSPSALSQRLAHSMAETSGMRESHVRGEVDADLPVETLIRPWRARAIAGKRVMELEFMKHRKMSVDAFAGDAVREGRIALRMVLDARGAPDGFMTKTDFNRAVGQAVRHGVETAENAEIKAAAEFYRDHVYLPGLKAAIEAKLLPDHILTESDAMKYLNRVYDTAKIVDKRPRFVEMAADYLEEDQATKRALIDRAMVLDVEQSALDVTGKTISQKMVAAQKAQGILQARLTEARMSDNRNTARSAFLAEKLSDIDADIARMKAELAAMRGDARADKAEVDALNREIGALEALKKKASAGDAEALGMDTSEAMDVIRSDDQLFGAFKVLSGRKQAPKLRTLLSDLRAGGGLTDVGGELAALGITSRTHPGLINKNGLSLEDSAGEFLMERGYHGLDPQQVGGIQDKLVEMIRRELEGNPTISPGNRQEDLLVVEYVQALEEAAGQAGIDLSDPVAFHRFIANLDSDRAGQGPTLEDLDIEIEAMQKAGADPVEPVEGGADNLRTRQSALSAMRATIKKAVEAKKRAVANRRPAAARSAERGMEARAASRRTDTLTARLDAVEERMGDLDAEQRAHDDAVAGLRASKEAIVGSWQGNTAESAQAALKARYAAEDARSEKIARGESRRYADVGDAPRLRSADDAVDQAIKRMIASRETKDMSRAELNDIASEIANRIVGTPDGRLPYDRFTKEDGDEASRVSGYGASDKAGQRGSTMARVWAIPDDFVSRSGIRYDEFLEQDIELTSTIYTNTMGPDVEFAKRFGVPGESGRWMEKEIKAVEADYDAKMGAPGLSVQDMNRLQTRKETDIKSVAGIRDRLRGVYALPAEPQGWAYRAQNVALSWNYMRLLGGMTLSAIPDMFHIVMLNGFKRSGLVPALQAVVSKEARGMMLEELQAFNVADDIMSSSRVQTVADFNLQHHRLTKGERAVQGGTAVFTKLSLMNYWNQYAKNMAGIVTWSRMLPALRQMAAGTASPKDAAKLAQMGIDAGWARRMVGMLDRHGEDVGGTTMPNGERWQDADAANRLRGALAAEVDRMIVTPGQERPLWMSRNGWRLIGQFRSFAVAAQSRVTMQGVQQRDAATLIGLTGMIAAGSLSYSLKQQVAGRDVKTDAYTLIKEGIDRSGAFGWAFDAHNTLEKATRGTIGLSALDDGPGMSRYASRNAVGSILGPTMGLLTDMFSASGAAFSGDFSRGDITAFRKLLPLQNLFYIRTQLNKLQEGVGDELGLAKTG